jgi:hypothetical protein
MSKGRVSDVYDPIMRDPLISRKSIPNRRWTALPRSPACVGCSGVKEHGVGEQSVFGGDSMYDWRPISFPAQLSQRFKCSLSETYICYARLSPTRVPYGCDQFVLRVGALKFIRYGRKVDHSR